MKINKKIHHIRFFISLLAFSILQSCAPVSVPPSRAPFREQEIAGILSSFKIQKDTVHNFFSLGRITVQGHGAEFEANFSIVGIKDPFEIKLEITHLWGRPLFHILITETRLYILSFTEKRYYLADVREPLPSNLFPVRLELDQLWAIGRGFPILYKHDHAVSTQENQISLLNGEGETLQRIEFYDQNIFPVQVFCPGQDLRLSFSEFIDDNSIQYAQKTQLYDQGHETLVILDIKQAVFNKAIDRSIFELVAPPDFECVQDSRLLDTH